MGCILQGVYEKNGGGDGVAILLWWLVLSWTEEWKWAGWLALPKLRVEVTGVEVRKEASTGGTFLRKN